jgi:PIN domain nuclease of toxin-antitoxin system
LILLDTQVLIWFSQGHPQLRPAARTLIEQETAAGTAVISPISFWEVAMLVDKAKIALGWRPLDWMESILDGRGFRLEPLAPIIAIDAGSLPGDIHGDPADRIIVATARHLACPVLTTDHKILAYGAQHHVKAIDARL